jgi:putative transposase
MTGFDTRAVAVPEQVSVAMAEIAADMREGLLALAVGAGLQVMQSLMEEDVAACCGPRGRAMRTGPRPGMAAGGGRSPWGAAGCR